ncbi:MAG: SAM-dependent methyltransferase [Neisseriaceae bacterium]
MTKLFLIPTTLSNTINSNVLLSFQLNQIKHLQYFIVETAKIGRQHLRYLQLDHTLQKLHIQELNKHKTDLKNLIQPLLDGFDMGLISDCGLPAVADPGSIVVKSAHSLNVEVVPLIGPSSLMLALMASGVNGQSFAFQGYLPIDSDAKKCKILQLQELILKHQQSQIIIETPFRNVQLFETLINILNKDITLCIAVNLMQETQKIVSKSINEWRKMNNLCGFHKNEVIFVIGI